MLKEFGLKTRIGVAETGVVGLLGDSNWPTIGFRADMDALPIEEKDTPHNAEYKSKKRGLMHGCGHDAHVAIMLGLAKWLAENPHILDDAHLSALFLFQPAEEGGGGARKMIEDGALKNPKPRILIAEHMYPELEVGNVGIYERQGFAYVDHFAIRFIGKGGHASRPHQCRDPIIAACYFATELQTVVSRSIDPIDPAVVTIGRINGGKASNVIPEEVELEGTMRALSGNTREIVWKRMRILLESVAAGFEVECEPIFSEWYPPCINDTTLARFLHKLFSTTLGKDKVHFLKPVMGAEDFAFYGPIIPTAIFRLGCANIKKGICWDSQTDSLIGLHSPSFDIDEDVLLIGVSILLKVIQMARKLHYFK
jgi:amidohydrolase